MLRLAMRVRREQAEIVLAELIELAPQGVEEVDLGDRVEYAVYGPPGELPALPDLTAAAGEALIDISTTEVADDWSERWRAFHRPLVLGRALTVRPPWEPPGETRLDVVIDPAQAFGTGSHATTRLSLELMLELSPGGDFLDIGCGSGVLAVAAAKLGWAPVRALDNDPAAVNATAANAAVNAVAVEVARWDLRTDPVPRSTTVAANLLGPLLLTLAGRIAVLPRRLLASGLLVTESHRIASAFGGVGMRETARRTQGEWAALLFERA